MRKNDGSAIFVRNLRRIMQENDLTQEDISKALGINRSTVSLWVNGVSYPRIHTLQKLADYLRIPVSELTSEQIDLTDPMVAQMAELLKGMSDEDKALILATLKRLTKDRG